MDLGSLPAAARAFVSSYPMQMFKRLSLIAFTTTSVDFLALNGAVEETSWPPGPS